MVDYLAGGSVVEIRLNNPLYCPIFVDVSVEQDSAGIENQLKNHFPLTLPPQTEDTVFQFTGLAGNRKSSLIWSVNYAQGPESVSTDSFFLPYPYAHSHTIMQGYNGNFSHNKDDSRYAIDFAMAVGDTVCAAAGGYVVGVIEGYRKGGKSSKWRDYANFINLYHPDKNIYTQYVHLRHNGSLVEVGDRVVAGQAIGLSGKTGWTSKPHLHFNVVRMEQGRRISLPMTFGQKSLLPGSELRKGSNLENLIHK